MSLLAITALGVGLVWGPVVAWVAWELYLALLLIRFIETLDKVG